MRLNDIIVESQQLDELTASDIGRGVGKVAKGIGAVAGGVAGIPGAVKKGFQAGKQTVSGAGDDQAAPADAATAEPAAQKPAGGGLKGVIDQFKKGFSQGRGAAPADQTSTAQGGATTAAAPAQTTAAPAQTNQPAAAAPAAPEKLKAGATAKPASNYKQVQAQVASLDKRSKQNLLKLLQKEFPQAAPAQATAAPAAEPAPAEPEQAAAARPQGGGKVAGQLSQSPAAVKKRQNRAAAKAAPAASAEEPAAAPTAATQNDKYPGLPPGVDAERANAANAKVGLPPIYTQNPDGTWRETDQAKGTWAGDTGGAAGITPAKKGRGKKAAAPSQAEIDADREAKMGPTSDSKINTGNPLAEALAARVEQHKRRMFETSLAKGQTSIFVK